MKTPERSVEEIVEETPKHYASSSTLPKQIVITLNDFKQAIQTERQKREEVVEALEAISKMCDGNNPAHEEIWHTAYGALQVLTQPNNPK